MLRLICLNSRHPSRLTFPKFLTFPRLTFPKSLTFPRLTFLKFLRFLRLTFPSLKN